VITFILPARFDNGNMRDILSSLALYFKYVCHLPRYVLIYSHIWFSWWSKLQSL